MKRTRNWLWLLALSSSVTPEAGADPEPLPIRLIAEAEDFATEAGAWRVLPWGENYFASTFAVTFLSRKACLSAPEQVERPALATLSVDIPDVGEFEILARYEQPWQFAAEFSLEIQQDGRVLHRASFGRLHDKRIWPLGGGEVPMKRFAWGGGDNIVWQRGGSVRLAAGKALLRLIAGPQLSGAQHMPRAARRNVDVIVLTNDRAGLEAQKKARYLFLDGWLVQDGDLYTRFTNPKDGLGPVVPVVEAFEQGQHSPYYVHIRDWPKTRVLRTGRLVSTATFRMAGPRSKSVRSELLAPVLQGVEEAALPAAEYLSPGETSGWVPLGQVLDALNDSLWLPRAIYAGTPAKDSPLDLDMEFAVPDGRGGLAPFRTLRVRGVPKALSPVALEIPGNVRASPRIRTQREAIAELAAAVAAFPERGALPRRFPIYGLLGFSGVLEQKDELGKDATALALALGSNTLTRGSPWADALGIPDRRTRMVTHWPVGDVERHLAKAEQTGAAPEIGVVSYGDEIRIKPVRPAAGEEQAYEKRFLGWLRSRSVRGPGTPHLTEDRSDPWFYYSQLFAFEQGLAVHAKATRLLEERLGSHVRTGMNYSPHVNYLVGDLHYVRPFKAGALTLPWSEDYVWLVPEFSVQATGYAVTGLRAGARYRDLPILMYVLPHSPGNTPRSFRLSFYTAVAHGARMLHLFCASPLAVAQTENYVLDGDIAMWRAIHDAVRDVGVFEDYVLEGRVRSARVGLLLSSVDEILSGDDNQHGGIHNQERKALYYALRHAQVPVDFVSEDDLIEGRADDKALLYLTQQYLHSKGIAALRRWVKRGGTLVATCGGFLDEFGRPNRAANALYGVSDQRIAKDPSLPMVLAKQDLPGLEPFDRVRWGAEDLPALVWKQGLLAKDGRVLGTFSEGSPAVVEKRHGRGRAVLLGFFPGIAYLQSGLPLKPVDRSPRDDGYAHFLPTGMDAALRRAAVDAFLPAGFVRPVETSAPFVEATLIEASAPPRLAVPLMNFSGSPIPELRVWLRDARGWDRVRSVEQGSLPLIPTADGIEVILPLDVADMLLFDASR